MSRFAMQLSEQINALIEERDAGADCQDQIDFLFAQFESLVPFQPEDTSNIDDLFVRLG